MLIFASLALNAYIWILNYMYDKREKYENSLKENQDAKKEAAKAEWCSVLWLIYCKLLKHYQLIE